MDRKPVVILMVVFLFVVISTIVLAGSTSPGAIGNTVWALKYSSTLNTTINFLPCFVLGFLGLLLMGWILSVSDSKSGSDTSVPSELFLSREDSGDRFDPNTIRTGNTPGTVIVRTLHGRHFVITKAPNGLAGYQEVDHRGRPVGHSVVADDRASLWAGDANKRLAKGLKEKVEKKPIPRNESRYPEETDYHSH